MVFFLCSSPYKGSEGKESACNVGDQGSILGQEDPWRMEWQPTPVFLSGESHGQRSLAGYRPWSHKVSEMIVTDFIFLGSKITTDSDCSHEIKRCLLFGRRAMTNLDTILKSRDVTLLIKVRIVKTMVFLVVMYGESWTIKKVGHQRIDAFEL